MSFPGFVTLEHIAFELAISQPLSLLGWDIKHFWKAVFSFLLREGLSRPASIAQERWTSRTQDYYWSSKS
jgi:hypothetical protein